jgi:hypothetical protein
MKKAITVVCALLVFGAVLKMKNTTTANIFVGYAWWMGSDTPTTVGSGIAGGVAGGALAGAGILTAVQGGATVGAVGGPVGVAAGAAVGAL